MMEMSPAARIASTPDHFVATAQPNATPVASRHGRKIGDGTFGDSDSTTAVAVARAGSGGTGSGAVGAGTTEPRSEETGARNPLATSAETGSGTSTRSGSGPDGGDAADGAGGAGPVLRSIHLRSRSRNTNARRIQNVRKMSSIAVRDCTNSRPSTASRSPATKVHNGFRNSSCASTAVSATAAVPATA